MRQQACPSCGAKAPSGRSYCPSCGAALDLEVEPLAAIDADGDDVELGRSRSRWWAAAAVVGVVAILGAGAIAAGGGATRAIDATTTTTTTSSTSTTVARTTSSVPRSTTVPLEPRRLTFPGAPFLEVASPPGVVLYGLARDQQELWRVDLLTGEATVRPIIGIADLRSLPVDGEPLDLTPRTGGVVLSSGSVPAVFVPDDLDAPFVRLDIFNHPLAHADAGLLWRIDDAGRDGLRARVVDMGGAAQSEPFAIPIGYPAGDDGTGRLMLFVANNLYALGLDGTTTRLGTGPIVAVRADRVVSVECADTEMRCDVVSHLRSDGSEVGRAEAPVGVVDSGLSGVLSPSGSTLALYDYTSSGVQLIHFDGREPTRIPFEPGGWGGGWSFTGPPVWWLDDELLCGVEVSGHVLCWRDGELLQASFGIPDLNPEGFSSVAFARP